MSQPLHPDVRTMTLADTSLEASSVLAGAPTASLAELAELGGERTTWVVRETLRKVYVTG